MGQLNGWSGQESSRGRLLVVEENRDLLEALQEMLEAMGFEVAAFPGEVPAIAATVGKKAVFDLLIADAVPAVGDGAGLVDRFRTRLGPMPTLLLSGAGLSGQLSRRAEVGNVAVLPAPFTARQLEEAVVGAMSAPQKAVAPVEIAPSNSMELPRGGSSGPGRSSLRWALPLAAGLLLAIGLSFQRPASGPPPLPSSPDGGALRGAAVEALEPRGELEASPETFVWTECPDAVGYILSVYRVDDSLAWRNTTRRAFDEPPVEVVAAFLPAVGYRWRVEALDAEGNPLARSARIEFRIRPSAREGSGKEEETP